MNDKQKEIDENYSFFENILDKIISEHKGEYALIRHKKIISYHKSFYDAENKGIKKYTDNLFSIQKVDKEPVNLGYFSYV